MTCDDYQLGYEMQLHGAPPSIPIEDITTHVTSCPSCTAYVAATRKAETMSTTTWLHNEPIDADLIRARIKKELSRQRVSNLVQLGAVAAYLAWLRPSVPELMMYVAVGLVGVVAINILRRSEFVETGAGSPGDLVAARRTQLDRRIARTRIAWLLPVMPLMFVLLSVSSRGATGLGLSQLTATNFLITTIGFCLIALLTLLQRRRDQRERRSIGE
jgi:hypothetical protein